MRPGNVPRFSVDRPIGGMMDRPRWLSGSVAIDLVRLLRYDGVLALENYKL
jgi:hypothetical protein